MVSHTIGLWECGPRGGQQYHPQAQTNGIILDCGDLQPAPHRHCFAVGPGRTSKAGNPQAGHVVPEAFWWWKMQTGVSDEGCHVPNRGKAELFNQGQGYGCPLEDTPDGPS